jgi:hypothetical protein
MTKRACSQMTANGTPCKSAAYANTDRCYAHLKIGPHGRPSLLTDETADQLVAMLRLGNYLYVAVRAAGISRQTFDRWMLRGESDLPEDEPFKAFRARVERARAEGQVRHVATVSRAAETDWRAATWLLERQYPSLWGAVSVKVRGDEAEPVEERAAAPAAADPFAEVDELAQRRKVSPG